MRMCTYIYLKLPIVVYNRTSSTANYDDEYCYADYEVCFVTNCSVNRLLSRLEIGFVLLYTHIYAYTCRDVHMFSSRCRRRRMKTFAMMVVVVVIEKEGDLGGMRDETKKTTTSTTAAVTAPSK